MMYGDSCEPVCFVLHLSGKAPAVRNATGRDPTEPSLSERTPLRRTLDKEKSPPINSSTKINRRAWFGGRLYLRTQPLEVDGQYERDRIPVPSIDFCVSKPGISPQTIVHSAYKCVFHAESSKRGDKVSKMNSLARWMGCCSACLFGDCLFFAECLLFRTVDSA